MHFLCRHAHSTHRHWLNALIQSPERFVFHQELRHLLIILKPNRFGSVEYSDLGGKSWAPGQMPRSTNPR